MAQAVHGPSFFQFPTESQPWVQRHVASIERRAFIFLFATHLPHTARTAAKPKIARTIRSSHTPRRRMKVVIVAALTLTRTIKSVVTGQAPVLGKVWMGGGGKARA